MKTTDNLLADFMEPTEVKTLLSDNDHGPQPNRPVIDEVISVEREPVPAEPPPPPAQPMLSPETQAEIYIGVVDTTQTVLFNTINRRKMKRRLGDKLEEAEKIFNEIERGSLKPGDLSPEQYGVFLRIKQMMDVADNIPFSEAEYAKIKVPLAKIISESGYDLPPSMALVLLGIEIMAPRITDAIFE